MTDFNRPIIEEFRTNHGRVGGMFEGAPLVLLTTTGARTGRPHTTPAVYAADAGRLVVFATNAGDSRAPAWLHNLRANPAVVVELGATRFDAVATEVIGPERDRLYAEQAERNPAFRAYQEGTTRRIQVVTLVPARVSAATAQLREIHAALRAQLTELRAAADAYAAGTGPRPELTRDLRRHCLSFCEALDAHHGREDSVLPGLAAQHPALAPVISRLQQEHAEVAALNTQLATLIESPDSGTDVRTALRHLSHTLESHYLYEELHLAPALDAA
jgi:deazaflavin-dependent oxidoreductase (nitroreductase family)